MGGVNLENGWSKLGNGWSKLRNGWSTKMDRMFFGCFS